MPDCRATRLTFTREGPLAGFCRSLILPNEFISNWTLEFPNMHKIFTVIINLFKFFLIYFTLLSPQFRRVCHLNAMVADH